MKIEFKYDLTKHNTFRMKVKCECFIEYDNLDELMGLNYRDLPKPILHIGEGSNLLFTKDFEGTILHSNIQYIKYIDMGLTEVPIMVGSGVKFDDFVAQTCNYGLWGAENLSLIPGEVGAAAVQNIGAYGVEFKDIVSGVVCYDILENKKVKFTVPECNYGYRDSFFKKQNGRYVVTSVLFRLSREPKPHLEYKGLAQKFADTIPTTPQQVRKTIIEIRNDKLPKVEEIGSAGSFFKNPIIERSQFNAVFPNGDAPHYDLEDGKVKIPAAWLIDKLGFKGKSVGGAAVYHKQPLVIINKSGNASGKDVLELENKIINAVRECYGITLSPEVEHI